MNINQQTLIKAAGIGAGIGLVYGIVANIPIVNLVCCCLGWLVMGGTGVVYGYFADQEGEPVDLATWAVGGAAAGAAAGLVRGIVSALAIVLISALGLGADVATQMAVLEDAGLDVPPAVAEQMVAGGAATFANVLTTICGSFFIYAILAAIGGAIFALIKQGQSRRSPAV